MNNTLEDLNDVAVVAGIDMTGHVLTEGREVTDSGTILTEGKYNGDQVIYVLSLSGSGGGGLITEEELAESLVPSLVVAQQSRAAVAQGLGYSLFQAQQTMASFQTAPVKIARAAPTTLTDIEPAAGGLYTPPPQMAAYAVGSFGWGQNGDTGNHAFNGALGLMARTGDHSAFGGGIIGSASTVDTQLDGRNELTSLGASLMGAYEQGAAGLRLYGTVAVAALDLDMDRHYMNGASVDRSHGDTDGIGYGASVYAGWAVPVDKATTVTPHGVLEYSRAKLDAYAEEGGAFPASYGDHTMYRWASRLGAAVDHRLTENVTVGATAGWGHRLKGDGGSYSASAAGFTLPLTGGQGDRDWLEGGVHGSLKLPSAALLTASMTARTGKVEEARADITVGVSVPF